MPNQTGSGCCARGKSTSSCIRVSAVTAKAIRKRVAVSGLSVVMDQNSGWDSSSSTCTSRHEGFTSGAGAEDMRFSLLGFQVWSSSFFYFFKCFETWRWGEAPQHRWACNCSRAKHCTWLDFLCGRQLSPFPHMSLPPMFVIGIHLGEKHDGKSNNVQ